MRYEVAIAFVVILFGVAWGLLSESDSLRKQRRLLWKDSLETGKDKDAE